MYSFKKHLIIGLILVIGFNIFFGFTTTYFIEKGGEMVPNVMAASSGISIQVSSSNTVEITNNISSTFTIYNGSKETIDLTKFKIRYYYTINGEKDQSFWCDYASNGSGNVKGSFTSMPTSTAKADYYLEISFTEGTISNDKNIQVQTRFSKSDWSSYIQSDDYSFTGSSAVTGYLDGVLVWGNEPVSTTPTKTLTPTPSKTLTKTPTPTKIPATPTLTPTPTISVISTSTPTPTPTSIEDVTPTYTVTSIITSTPTKTPTKKKKSGGGGGGGVIIKSNNSYLESLNVIYNSENLVLSPAFDKDTLAYTANVQNDALEVSLKLIAEDDLANISIKNVSINSTDLPYTISLETIGDSVIPVVVKAEDGTTKTYTVTIKITESGTAEEITKTLEDLTNHWSKKYITDLISKGIFKGYPDGSFGPDRVITRAEVAVILAKILKLEPVANPVTNYSDDTELPDWVKGYIKVVEDNKLMVGYEDNSFRSYNNLTRAEMAVVITKVLGYQGAEISVTNFTDDSSILKWSRGFILKANELGFINGYPDGTFSPNNNITRAEVCTIISKALSAKK